MKTVARRFWAVVIAQAVFLLAWAGWHEQLRSRAPVVRLKTRPVDPRDLLRGDYMILGYEIGEVPVPAKDNPIAAGTDVWVVLEPRGEHHAAVRASWEKPDLAAGQIAVLGQVQWRGGRGVAYGIEQFFVPEGKGTPRFKTMEVEAAVSPFHRLYIKRVLLDGRAYP